MPRLVKSGVIRGRPRQRVFRSAAAALPVEAVLRPRDEHAQRPLLRLEVVGEEGVLGAVLPDLVREVAAVVRQVAQLTHLDANLVSTKHAFPACNNTVTANSLSPILRGAKDAKKIPRNNFIYF